MLIFFFVPFLFISIFFFICIRNQNELTDFNSVLVCLLVEMKLFFKYDTTELVYCFIWFKKKNGKVFVLRAQNVVVLSIIMGTWFSPVFSHFILFSSFNQNTNFLSSGSFEQLGIENGRPQRFFTQSPSVEAKIVKIDSNSDWKPNFKRINRTIHDHHCSCGWSWHLHLFPLMLVPFNFMQFSLIAIWLL